MTEGQAVELVAQVESLPDVEVQKIADMGWVKRTVIRSQKSYEKVLGVLGDCQDMRKNIAAHYTKIKRPINDLRKQVLDMEKVDLASCADVESHAQGLINGWEAKKDAEAKALLEQQMAEAKEQAEQERAENLARLEAAKGNAPNDAAREGIESQIDAYADLPAKVAVSSVPAPYVRPAGFSRRDTYTAIVEDLRALVAAVAEGRADLSCIQANMTHLNAKARQQRELLSIPGVRIHKTPATTTTFGGRRGA